MEWLLLPQNFLVEWEISFTFLNLFSLASSELWRLFWNLGLPCGVLQLYSYLFLVSAFLYDTMIKPHSNESFIKKVWQVLQLGHLNKPLLSSLGSSSGRRKNPSPPKLSFLSFSQDKYCLDDVQAKFKVRKDLLLLCRIPSDLAPGHLRPLSFFSGNLLHPFLSSESDFQQF